jgi:hypothetical protein
MCFHCINMYEDTQATTSVGSGSAAHALQPYFGSVAPQYQKMLAEDKFAHETYNLPKAYAGKCKHLETVLDYLITKENDWYTRDVLPWVLTDDLSVSWEIFRFNKTLMDLEPHLVEFTTVNTPWWGKATGLRVSVR